MPIAAARIAVLRALPGLGDLLCAVPALRALRTAYPEAHITLLGLPTAQWFADRFAHYVDELVPVSFPGLVETAGSAQDALAFLSDAQKRGFDLALGLHGSGPASNILLSLLGATHQAGCYLAGQPAPDVDGFIPYPADIPEIRRVLAPLQRLGIPARGDHLEWPALASDRPGPDLPRPFAVLHPGASRPDRRWSTDGFAAVGAALQHRGVHLVLTGGAPEADTTAQLRAAIEHSRVHDGTRPRPSVVDLAGRTSLDQLADVLRRAQLTVSNDTGVAHLAAAVQAPSVVVFTTSDPRRWAPLDRERHRVVDLRPEVATRVQPDRRCLADGCLRDRCPGDRDALAADPAAAVEPPALSQQVARVLAAINAPAVFDQRHTGTSTVSAAGLSSRAPQGPTR